MHVFYIILHKSLVDNEIDLRLSKERKKRIQDAAVSFSVAHMAPAAVRKKWLLLA